MFNWLFLDHPRSVGESYFGHQRQAMAFRPGTKMFLGRYCVLFGMESSLGGVHPNLGSRTVSSSMTEWSSTGRSTR